MRCVGETGEGVCVEAGGGQLHGVKFMFWPVLYIGVTSTPRLHLEYSVEVFTLPSAVHQTVFSHTG